MVSSNALSLAVLFVALMSSSGYFINPYIHRPLKHTEGLPTKKSRAWTTQENSIKTLSVFNIIHSIYIYMRLFAFGNSEIPPTTTLGIISHIS